MTEIKIDKKNIYIVVVTYNGMSWIEQCLNSCKDFPIIVVDNNSSDNTVSFIKKNYPNVHLISQSKNLGFGKANNIGMSYALKQNCEYVFLLNQDAYLKPYTIEKLVDIHKKYPAYAILSPIHINKDENKLDRNFSYYISFDRNPFLYFDSITQNLKEVYEVPFVNAAAWLLPKNTLNTIGGFDPIFFHYGEDDNYCQRVLYHKLKIGIVPDAFVIHDRKIKTNQPIEPFSKDYFIEKEKKYKMLWANINIDIEKKIEYELKKIKSKQKKAKLKLLFSLAKNYKTEYVLLKKTKETVLNSRKITTKKAAHFLHIID